MTDRLRDLASPVLRTAAERAQDNLAGSGGGPELVEDLRLLVSAVDANGTGDELPLRTSHESGLLLWLLQQLQAEVVQLWAAAPVAPPATEMLRLLRSFERVRRSLSAGVGEEFPPLHAAATGAELVVELAHDLRSPLTSIVFLSESLRAGQSGPVTPLQHRQLGIIYTAALGLVSMASDIIELAKGGDRLLDRKPTDFSISEMFASIRDVVLPIVEERRLTLSFSPPEEDRRQGFPVALSRVLLNLTINALRCTDEGSVSVTARATGARSVLFSVQDTGKGLDEDTVRHLYAPVHRRSEGGRYGFSGSGLGLATCRRLVRSMGSELHFETVAGQGTRFFFEIELDPAPGR